MSDRHRLGTGASYNRSYSLVTLGTRSCDLAPTNSSNTKTQPTGLHKLAPEITPRMAVPQSPRASRRISSSRSKKEYKKKESKGWGWGSSIYLFLAMTAIIISLSLQKWLSVYTENSQKLSAFAQPNRNQLRASGSSSSGSKTTKSAPDSRQETAAHSIDETESIADRNELGGNIPERDSDEEEVEQDEDDADDDDGDGNDEDEGGTIAETDDGKADPNNDGKGSAEDGGLDEKETSEEKDGSTSEEDTDDERGASTENEADSDAEESEKDATTQDNSSSKDDDENNSPATE